MDCAFLVLQKNTTEKNNVIQRLGLRWVRSLTRKACVERKKKINLTATNPFLYYEIN